MTERTCREIGLMGAQARVSIWGPGIYSEMAKKKSLTRKGKERFAQIAAAVRELGYPEEALKPIRETNEDEINAANGGDEGVIRALEGRMICWGKYVGEGGLKMPSDYLMPRLTALVAQPTTWERLFESDLPLTQKGPFGRYFHGALNRMRMNYLAGLKEDA